MKTAGHFIAVVAVLALAGCGPGVRVTDVDAPAAQRLNSEIKVIEGPVPAGASVVGPVEATSCKNKAWDPAPTNANAIVQLKAYARERGANAVKNVFCEPPQGTSLGTNCWSSIRCTATAYSVPG